ncbi:MAG TPA: CvpA family protein, partial [Acidimicrobiales bacterium]|nr:CvpA family protein [Acidimicrobiales bacterium]
MSALDLVVVAGAAVAVVGGFRVGFLARAASWFGLVVGFYLALRVLPSALSWLELPSPTGRLVLALAGLVVGTFAGQAAGLVLGHRMRGVLPPGGARTADRVVGAVAGAVAVLAAVWLVAPALAEAPGWPARAARGSALIRGLEAALPPAPDATRRL